MQIVLNKTYIVEKLANAQDRAGETQQANLTNQAKQENDKRANSVNETEEAEGKTIDTKERERRKEEERKKRERRKKIAKKLQNDSGHIIDLEA
ncbi:MAG: hypothetical protein C0602_04275 [Denitrovibrio sp.]|nr:MAG: hypothetical protein C0602_04275 [Denitrovibrio sp.]